jgi:Tol biopolymer transport system component
MRRLVNSLLIFSFILLVSISVTQAQMPGDVNDDSLVDVGDVVYEINYLFRHGAYPLCLDCADANGSCNIEIGDVVYLINYLFKAGSEPLVPECDWSEPVNLGPVINSTAGQVMFRLSSDGHKAVWSSNRPGGYGNLDIWYSLWNTDSSRWSNPQNCGRNVNGGFNEEYPSFSPDGSQIYCLIYDRPGGLGDWDLWISTWDSLNNQWGLVQNPGPSLNNYGVWAPFLSPDGTKLFCAIYALAVFEWNGTDWSGPFDLGPNINVTGGEDNPSVTADNNTLYFTRSDYKERYYICVSHWTGTEWGVAEVLGPQINDSLGSNYPYITPDGSKLYFNSIRPGSYGIADIWVSERIPTSKLKQTKQRKFVGQEPLGS